MEDNNGQVQNFNVSSQPATKSKGKGGIIVAIIFILVIVAGLAIGALWLMNNNKPDVFYKKILSSNVNKYTSELKDQNYKTVKSSVKLNANVNIDNNEIDEEIIKIINKTNIELETQMDIENNKMIVNLDSNYGKHSLLNAQVYSDVDEENTYLYLEDIFDKYIELDMDELSQIDFYSTLSEMFENQRKSNNDKENIEKSMKILNKELSNMVKKDYCSSSKEEVEVNGRNIKTTKNTIKMTGQQLKDEIITLLMNLKNNDEFIDCFDNKEELQENMVELLDNVEKMEVDEEATIEINAFTQGLMNDVVKVAIEINTEEIDINMEFTKIEDDKYNFNINYFDNYEEEEKDVLKGTISLKKKNENEGNVVLEFEVEEFGKIALNIEYSMIYNEKLDEIDTDNSVKLNKITYSDQKKIITNLQKSKLYEIISNINGISRSSNNNNSIVSFNENVEKKDTNEEKNSNETTNILSGNVTSGVSEDEILTYDNKTKIIFRVPDGFKVNTTSENYKRLVKNEGSIKISSTIATEDNYYDALQKNVEKYSSDEKYQDVNLTSVETIHVEGVTLYSSTLSYKYVSGSYETPYSATYIWTKANDKYIVEFQITNAEIITEAELKEILSIKIENV